MLAVSLGSLLECLFNSLAGESAASDSISQPLSFFSLQYSIICELSLIMYKQNQA